ncbi:hypothetical protein [Corynebacterium coyleae]|uniref:hypothetical protein n=1 Tax=Corynebacterium coyleae TaxID=53374 RepID=UPI00254F5D9B|nr:hypothetical protein [Corynebacterium coyleae]MDK8241705.1 hypothetical protein [Corynebacterium coyleae]
MITNTIARRNQNVILENGETFTVASVRNTPNPDNYDEPEKGIYGINPDGTEFGPYFVVEYAILN